MTKRVELFKFSFSVTAGTIPERSVYIAARNNHRAIDVFNEQHPNDVMKSIEWIGEVWIHDDESE